MNKLCAYFLSGTITTLLAGCSLIKQTDPLPDTFLEGAPVESAIPRVPFIHAWASDAVLTNKATSLYLLPVRTDKVDPETWMSSSGFSITSSNDYNEEVQKLAVFFHQRLSEELARVYSEHPRLKIVSAPAPDALNLEIALTEVVFSRPVTNVAAAAAPVPGVDFAISAMTTPYVAFAGRFTSPDGAVLLGTVGDRRSPPLRPIDLNKFTVASANRDIVSQWARELAEAVEFDTLAPVQRSSRFSLLPW